MRINAAVAAACRKTVKNKALKAQFPGCGGPAGAGKPPEIHHFAPECATILVTGHFSLFDHDFTQSFRIRHGAADEAAICPRRAFAPSFLLLRHNMVEWQMRAFCLRLANLLRALAQ